MTGSFLTWMKKASRTPGAQLLGTGLPREQASVGIQSMADQFVMTKKPLTSDEVSELTLKLNRLARNLWWTWDQEAQDIFQELSPRGWQNLFHNAVAVLHEVSAYELGVRLQDHDFAERVRDVLKAFDAYMQDKLTWGHENAKTLLANPVAYFSAEFGFHETLPIAAGGLGVLAGDHTKAASDLGIGFAGISLFYREG